MRLIDGSRMSREIHIRFWEGVEVRFPHATRLWPIINLTFFSCDCLSLATPSAYIYFIQVGRFLGGRSIAVRYFAF